METKIVLKDLKFHAYHGALKQEHVVGTTFIVNLEIGVDFSEAMKTDRLRGTINYTEIYDIVHSEMMKRSQLVEHVAGRIVETLFRAFPSITSIHVSLLKQNPPIPCCQSAGMGVEIKALRADYL